MRAKGQAERSRRDRHTLWIQQLNHCASIPIADKIATASFWHGEKRAGVVERGSVATTVISVEEIQQGWHELSLRVGQLETERDALERENKALRMLLERLVDHRQKSHSELVLLLAGLVSKLPINDVGGIVSRLVEHNKNVGNYLTALIKSTGETEMPQIEVLKTLDTAKHDLAAAIKPLIEELSVLKSPFEKDLLESVVASPDAFFTPRMLRANRCFMKGCVAKERIVREFGQPALSLFNDLTTDPKRNPHPKQEEIVLGFKNDFEALLQQEAGLSAEKKLELQELFGRVTRSRGSTEDARRQRSVFLRLSFLLELLHFYEQRSADPPDVVFAQRLPNLVEQLVLTGPEDPLEEKLIVPAESLMVFVVNPDHRHAIINNTGKSSDAGKTLRFVLKLRGEKVPDDQQVNQEFVRHLLAISPQKPPAPAPIAAILRLINPEMRLAVIKTLMHTDRLRHDEAAKLARAVAGLLQIELPRLEDLQVAQGDQGLIESQRAWADIKQLITKRKDPATIATAIRDRLNARYDADEVRQSWITLTECDPMTLIRVFCYLPYLPTGKTDPIARPVLETYVSRLTHEKYASTYHKVASSLRNLHQAKPDSPILLNFTALVRWVNPETADHLCHAIGMPVGH